MGIMYFVIICVVFAVGRLLAKLASEKVSPSEEKKLLGGFISVNHIRNRGAIMNKWDKHTKIVTIISSAIFLIVLVWFVLILRKKGYVLMKTGLALLLGGAAGNEYERIRKGYVSDYFSFCFLKKVVFNISDIFIIVGALLTIIGEY